MLRSQLGGSLAAITPCYPPRTIPRLRTQLSEPPSLDPWPINIDGDDLCPITSPSNVYFLSLEVHITNHPKHSDSKTSKISSVFVPSRPPYLKLEHRNAFSIFPKLQLFRLNGSRCRKYLALQKVERYFKAKGAKIL